MSSWYKHTRIDVHVTNIYTHTYACHGHTNTCTQTSMLQTHKHTRIMLQTHKYTRIYKHVINTQKHINKDIHMHVMRMHVYTRMLQTHAQHTYTRMLQTHAQKHVHK
jgi:hypothetical protein